MSHEVTLTSDSQTLLSLYASMMQLPLKQKNESEKDIPTELFRFRSHEQLLALENTNNQRQANRAFTCQAKFDELGSEAKVILFTSINPKVVGGNLILFPYKSFIRTCLAQLFLNATSGTHFYFDCETSVGKQHFERLVGDGSNASSSSSKVVPAQKIGPLTIAELNQYVLTADPQIIEFLCKAEATSVQSEKGWSYIGCSKCAKKLQRDESSFTSLFCDRQNDRYHVELSVKDRTDDAGTGINAKVDTEFPPSLNEIVGKTFTFQLKLGKFNFTSKKQTFTVSRIITEHERAPLPAFVNDDGDDHGPDDNGDGAGLTDDAIKQRLVNGENLKNKARQEYIYVD
ncbi:unnamed protein product [Eruca vesicaria subsp. sativa]|uniref:Replication factor A C-terminal domain-containing protein n=1 Tax=Eruca vesicaria subsp. sativa TaxID=29727 RepID=A0ABC8J7Z3_ERUVS|nr:unnamed protein product [Eruca vesicaria subsp. sativa]